MIQKRNLPHPALVWLCFLLLAPVSPSSADSVSSSGAQFLQIPAGVRASGMGGAFTALADDASAAYWNAAGLAQLSLPQISLSHVSYFESINYEFIGGVLPLAPGSTLGLTANLDSVPSFDSTGGSSSTPGSAMDWDLGFELGQSFGDHFSLGLGAKFIDSTLVSYSASGEAFDAGLLVYTTHRELTLGLAVQNVGQISGYGSFGTQEKLPTTYRVGLAYRFEPLMPNHFSLDLDLEKPIDQDPILHAGGEVWLGFKDLSVAFRGGYSLNPLNSDLGGTTGASVGAGVVVSPFEFEYALVPFGALGNINEFALTYRFEPSAAEAAQAAAQEKPAELDIKPQLADFKTGSVQQATFEIKPQARTEIKNWTLEIRDPSGNLVRTYTGQGLPPKQIAWDGRDAYGHVVPQGIFANYNFKTEDVRGQQLVSSNSLFKLSGPNAANITPGVMTPQLAAMIAQAQAEPVYVPVMPEAIEPLGPRGEIKAPAVGFAEGSSRLDPAYAIFLDQVAKTIRLYPRARVYIEGHVSSDEPVRDPLALSQNRADSVLRYLVEKGHVSPGNLYARGHGKTELPEESADELAHFKTRCVEIIILTK
ncbi:MAG TPA: PorV/PorQ family protein [bacterium]|nr:PorV/PorQ family protein [bacterium]